MLGFVFTELLRMAEQRFDPAAVDRAVTSAGLAAVRTNSPFDRRPPGALLLLITHLSQETAAPVSELQRALGEHLFDTFMRMHADLLDRFDSALDLLSQLDGIVHQEIRHRLPEAEPPRLFTAVDEECDRLTLIYRSPLALSDLAYGLMIGCANHFQEPIIIAKEDLSEGEGVVVRFTLERWAAPSVALFQGVLERRG